MMESLSGKQRGFTLTEILIAMAIMAFAVLPIVGILWSGVSRTDISVTYENASGAAVSVLEYLLSDAIKFEDLDFSNPAAPADRDTSSSKESAGLVTSDVEQNKFLGPYCTETAPSGLNPAECNVAMSRSRYFQFGRENYHTDLYIGAYYEGASASAGAPTTIAWGYLPSPFIDYESLPGWPHIFYDTLLLSNSTAGIPSTSSWDDFSPYFHDDWNTGMAPRVKTDLEISLPMPRFTRGGVTQNLPATPPYPPQFFTNFAKIQLFIRWGLDWQTRGTDVTSRGGAKTLELVTFKGRL